METISLNPRKFARITNCKYLTYKEWKQNRVRKSFCCFSQTFSNYLTYKEWKQIVIHVFRISIKDNVITLPIRNTQTYIHKVGMQKLKGEQ